MKMEQCSETSAYKIQTPRNYPEDIQIKVRFVTRLPFRILLLGACSGKLYFACVWRRLCIFQDSKPWIRRRRHRKLARCCRPYICEETLFSRGVDDLDVCPGHRAEGGAKSTSQILPVLFSWYASFRRVHKIAKSDYWLCYVCPSVHLSAWNNSAAIRRILM
jgi:hypothetical protein